MTSLEPETICEKCGKVHKTWHGHPSCIAHKQGSNPLEPCSKPPKRGMRTCRTHGSRGIAKAEERIRLMEAQGEIAELMRECDIPDQHPIDGLLEVVRVSGAMMRLLTLKVGELSEDPTISEVLVEKSVGKDVQMFTKKVSDGDAFWGLDKDEQMTPHIYVQLLKIWTERYEKACATALSAGIEERRIRMAEETADTFFSALSKALVDVSLPPTQQAALMQALAKQLRQGNLAAIDLV